MDDILARIVSHKEIELPALRQRSLDEDWAGQVAHLPPPADFLAALQPGPRMRVIAEVKHHSPSAGTIRDPFDPVEIAETYHRHGADCLSVLTDERFFGGSMEHLRLVARSVPLPILRKEFVLDESQVLEARLGGASAVLLIAECLSPARLHELVASIQDTGMTPLVELHDPVNLPSVVASGAPIIGINNRNLRTFKTDVRHTLDLLSDIPAGRLVVSESGIKTREDVARLRSAGVGAILVGESLLRSNDPGARLAELVGN